MLNQDRPFFCPLIKELIENTWFPASARVKVAHEAAKQAIQEKMVSVNMILLVSVSVCFLKFRGFILSNIVLQIQHTLNEWFSGSRPTIIGFKEDAAAKM